MGEGFRRHNGDDYAVHSRLRRVIEKRERSWLWVPEHAITFVPRLLTAIYGDGRALFAIATINQRPAYWVIRGCSTWGCDFDREDATGPDFGEMSDDIMTELEEQFGRGRCGYSGNSLFQGRKQRIQNCQCDECTDRYNTARWPMVNNEGGCSWSRIDWPKGFPTRPNPLSPRGNLLAAEDCPNG